MNNSAKLMQVGEDTGISNASASVSSTMLDYDSVLTAVWDHISNNTSVQDFATTPAKVAARQVQILKLIESYVEDKKPAVKQITADLAMKSQDLIERLKNDITQHGVITPAYVDPNVSEIQINDYQTIWVERNGDMQILCDEVTGERITFKSIEECEATIIRLLRNSKSKFSAHNTIAKGRTAEGYRVAAIHAHATAGEKGKYQNRTPSPSAVIRKFPESNFTAKDMVTFGSMCAEMANAITILPKSDVTILVVGSTGSGKTVLVQLVLNNVPSNMRIYAIENPSELGIKKYNSKGQVINNVIQYEALADATNEDRSDATRHTEINLMMQALRMTPHYFVFGEVRYNEEINQAMVAANTGHKFVTTFHAPDDNGAIRRVLNAIIAVNPGIPVNIVMEDVCSNVDFIYSIAKRWDRSRKVLALTEVRGVTYEGGLAKADLNRIFEYRAEKKRPGDKKMRGAHWQVNEFSPSMIEHMMSSAMDVTEFELLTKPLERDEAGNTIPRKGIYDTDLLVDDNEVEQYGIVKAMQLLCERYVAKGLPAPIQIDITDEEAAALAAEAAAEAVAATARREEAKNSTGVQDLLSPGPQSRLLNQEPSVIGAGPNNVQVAIATAVIDVMEAKEVLGLADPDELDLDALAEVITQSSGTLEKMDLTARNGQTVVTFPPDEKLDSEK